jgi:hypothetical protein
MVASIYLLTCILSDGEIGVRSNIVSQVIRMAAFVSNVVIYETNENVKHAVKEE